MSTAELLTQNETPPRRIRLNAAIVGTRLHVRNECSNELVNNFLKDLGFRWSTSKFYWYTRPTLATCWQIMFHAPAIVEADSEVERQAHKFFDQIHRVQKSEGQPELRKNDSWKHQLDAYWFAWHREAALLAMWMGCVDAETEVLTPSGWIKIAKWDGQPVAQFDPQSRQATFVENPEYVKLPCPEFIHFNHVRGLDQMLSPEHRVLYYDHKENPRVCSAEELAANRGTKRFLPCFDLQDNDLQPGLRLSDAHLRLQVAIIADGHFPAGCKTDRVIVRLKKPRKIQRMKYLLKISEIDYSCSKVKPDGFVAFRFSAPIKVKEFDERFWAANHFQRVSIADECVHWDGSVRKSGAVEFSSRSLKSAEFIQYCFSSTGQRASLTAQNRGEKMDYTVHVVGDGRSGNLITFPRMGGERVPSVDGFKYCFAVPTTYLVFRRNGHVFTSGNTGKSKVAVDLIRNREAKRVLIVCPVSVRGVWRRELLKHGDLEALVLEKGTSKKKVQQAIEYETLCLVHQKPFIVVVNYETAKSDDFSIWSLKQRWSVVIGDESHRFKSAESKISKYMGELSMEADFRLCLTGTPMPHSPLDLFGQFRFLDAGVFGSSYHRFRSMYAISGPFGADHIVGFKNQGQLAERMRMLTYEVDQSVLDLPAVTQEQRPVTLEPSSLKVYEEMKEDMIAFLEDGGEVTAPNGLVKLLRLAQVTGGFVKGDDEILRELGKEKEGALSDLLEDLNEPVVVFCRFKHDLDVIRKVTESLSKGQDERGKAIKKVYGEVSGRQKDLTPHSTMPDNVDVMGVQIQAGGVGIDLTRARVGVYFSVGYSLGEFDQSVARLHRPGQTRPVVFYHLVATKTVDEVIYRSLESKREIVQEVISYLRGENL